MYSGKFPAGSSLLSQMDQDWNACLQTLGGHGRYFTSIAFSPNSQQLALASWDHTIKL